MGEQGESKVEKRLRIEGKGIGKKNKGFKEERNGTGKKNKLQTLRSLRWMDVLLQDRAPQDSLVSRNYLKKLPIVFHSLERGGWLCLYHHQGSQIKHLPNGQHTPKV